VAKAKPSTAVGAQWWDAHKVKRPAHELAIPWAERVFNQQTARREAYYYWALIFGDDLRTTKITSLTRARLTFNYAKSTIETWVAKHTKSRVLPMVITQAGDYGMQQRAKGTNLFIDAEFERCEIYDLDGLWMTDAAVAGTYFAQVGDEDGKVTVERVPLPEILLDDIEWRYGKGRTIGRTFLIDREVLKGIYPDSADDIQGISNQSWDASLYGAADMDSTCDMVQVWMMWHRQSAPDKGDGRFVVCARNCTLEDESYEEDDLPIIIGQRCKPRAGIWGDSIMRELAPGQSELDFVSARQQEAIHLVALPRIILQKGSKLAKGKIDNLIGSILELTGPPPIAWNASPFPPELPQHYQNTVDRMMNVARVSQMAAQSKIPAGITAARALQLLDDQESEGFIVSQRLRDSFYVRLAKRMIATASKLEGYKISAKDGRHVVPVDLAKVMLDEDEMGWDVMPTNFKAKTPAARMQQAEDLKNMGQLPPEKIAKFLDIPDLETETSLINAPYDNIARRIALILEEGKYLPPNPFMNLQATIKMARDAYNRAECDGVPAEKMEFLRSLAVDAASLLADANRPPPTPGPAIPPGAGAPDMGMPPGPMPPPAMPEGMPPGAMPGPPPAMVS